jgi:hypothetical protein
MSGQSLPAYLLTFVSTTVFLAILRKFDHNILSCFTVLGAETAVALYSWTIFCHVQFLSFCEASISKGWIKVVQRITE